LQLPIHLITITVPNRYTHNTSGLTAGQFITGWLLQLQPHHQCQRLCQIYRCDPDSVRSDERYS